MIKASRVLGVLLLAAFVQARKRRAPRANRRPICQGEAQDTGRSWQRISRYLSAKYAKLEQEMAEMKAEAAAARGRVAGGKQAGAGGAGRSGKGG